MTDDAVFANARRCPPGSTHRILIDEIDQLRAALERIRDATKGYPIFIGFWEIANAALAGVQAKDEGEGCEYHHPIRVKGCRYCDEGVQTKEHDDVR